MHPASLLLLARLATAGPNDCTPSTDRSGGRALSDDPYSASSTCSETAPDVPQRGAPLPADAALDNAVSPERRLAFGLIGTGASFIVLGGLVLMCSATSALPQQQKTCRDLWPWVGGAGLVTAGVGVSLIIATSHDSGGVASRGRGWEVGPMFTWALP